MNARIILICCVLFATNIFCTAQNASAPGDSVVVRYAIMEKAETDTTTGLKEGRYRYYFDNHQLIEGFYKGGKKSGYWEFFDYDGNVRMKGFYQDDNPNGAWKYYYKDGTLASEINYVQGKRDGPAKGFYENNKPASGGVYLDDKRDGIWMVRDDGGNLMEKSFHSNGYVDSSFYYHRGGEIDRIIRYKEGMLSRYTVFFKNGNVFYEVIYRDGVPYQSSPVQDISGKQIRAAELSEGDGVLYLYYPPYDTSGNVTFTLRAMANYQNGIAQGYAEFYDREGKLKEKGSYNNGFESGSWILYGSRGVDTIQHKPMPADTTSRAPKDLDISPIGPDANFIVIEHMPEFPGQERALLGYLSSIPYPPIARENDIEGSVYVKFVIDQAGEVTNVEVVKGADRILNDASTRHIKKMPRWIPGFQNGLPVRVQYVVPIKFVLN